MTIADRIGYLQENHFGKWLSMRAKVFEEMSEMQSMFCVCRRLATGLHENSCRKFQNKVNSETAKRLSDLIPAKV